MSRCSRSISWPAAARRPRRSRCSIARSTISSDGGAARLAPRRARPRRARRRPRPTAAPPPLRAVRGVAHLAAAHVCGARRGDCSRIATRSSSSPRDDDDNVREAAVEGLPNVAGHDADARLHRRSSRGRAIRSLRAAALALDGHADRAAAVPALKAALAAAGRGRTRQFARRARRDRRRRWPALGVEPAPSSRRSGQPLAHRPISNADDSAAPGGAARAASRSAASARSSWRCSRSQAPATVLRFARLAESGYYNGLTFHRVVPNFVIQGGSPGANEYIGDAAFMRDEVGLWPHVRGAVGISTRGRDTGDAQIFVDLVDNPRLDHDYTVFAQVLNGIDVVDRILEGDVIERIEIIGLAVRTDEYADRCSRIAPADEPASESTDARCRGGGVDGARAGRSSTSPIESHARGIRLSRRSARAAGRSARAPLRPAAVRATRGPSRPSPPTTRAGASPSRPTAIVLTASTSEAYSLLFKLLARRRRRSAGAAAELSAVRAPDASRFVTRGPTTSNTTAPGRSTSASIERALSRARAPCWSCQSEQSDRIVRHARRARPAGGALRARATSRSSPTRCSPTTSCEPAPRRGSGRAASRGDVLTFALGGLSKSVGLPQVKLGWIAVGRSRCARRRAALDRLELVCDTYLSVSTPGAGRGGRAARARRGASARRSRRARPPNYRCASEAVAAACRLPRAAQRGRLVRGAAGAVARSGRRSRRSRLLENDGVLAHPGTSSTFRANRFSSSACCRRTRRSPTASRACSAALRLHASVRDHESARRSAPASGSAHSAVLVPVDRELGHRRHRRSRAAHRAGWPAPASACCSCCRSTRWRPASSRRTRRSARWRSIRSTSACRRVPEFAALGGEAALSAGDRRRCSTRSGARRAIDYRGGPAR